MHFPAVTKKPPDFFCLLAFRCLPSVEQAFQIPRWSPGRSAQHHKLQQGTSGKGERVEEAAGRAGNDWQDAGEPVSCQGFASGLSFPVSFTLKD